VQQRPFVSLALRSTTPGAHFRFEDGREGPNPYVALVPRDDRAQVVWVEAPGYVPQQLSLGFGDDVTVDEIVLAEAPGAGPADASPRPPRRNGRGPRPHRGGRPSPF
jgi:hypothetical protein